MCVVLTLFAAGCQNNRSAVVPPPQGFLNGPDVYYTPPAGTGAAYRPGSTGNTPAAVSLAPPPKTSASATPATNRSSLVNTYDVATRTAADSEPIRVLEPATRAPGTAVVARGMPINDGTQARPWRTTLPLPASVSSNPFSGLRGAADTRADSSQGFSGQDGQWRSRNSYEGTERR